MTTTDAKPKIIGGDPRVRSSHWIVLLITLILGVATYQVNATMLSPAIPDIVSRLGTNAGQVGLSQTLFFLSGGIGGVVFARYSDHIGRRKMLLSVLAVTCVGTVISMFAPNVAVLFIGRVLQGAASASFQLAYLTLHDTLDSKRFGRALGLVTAINGGIAGVDGIAGGALVDAVGFRAIFAFTLLLGLVAIGATVLFVPETAAHTSGRMDWVGSAVLSLSLIAVNMGIYETSDNGWLSAPVIGLLVAGVVLFAVFLEVEKRRRTPLFATRYMLSRQGWPLLVTTLLTLSGLFATINFTVPLLSQHKTAGFAMSATTSAFLFLMPTALIGFLVAPFAGQLAPKLGWRRTLWVGMIGTIGSMVLAAVGVHSWVAVFIALILAGAFYTGIAMTALTGLSVVLSPKDSPAALPGMNGACFGIGASLGMSAAASLVGSSAAEGATSTSGFSAALFAAVGLSVAALLASLAISNKSEISTDRI